MVKEYDCIFGSPGGLDNSYIIHLEVKDWGIMLVCVLY